MRDQVKSSDVKRFKTFLIKLFLNELKMKTQRIKRPREAAAQTRVILYSMKQLFTTLHSLTVIVCWFALQKTHTLHTFLKKITQSLRIITLKALEYDHILKETLTQTLRVKRIKHPTSLHKTKTFAVYF